MILRTVLVKFRRVFESWISLSLSLSLRSPISTPKKGFERQRSQSGLLHVQYRFSEALRSNRSPVANFKVEIFLMFPFRSSNIDETRMKGTDIRMNIRLILFFRSRSTWELYPSNHIYFRCKFRDRLYSMNSTISPLLNPCKNNASHDKSS